MYNTLGYASISSFADTLGRVIGKKILVDDALFDETTYGLGKARDFTLSQYEKVCGKFKKGLHVKNIIVESEIKSFFGVGFDETESEIYISFRTWVSRLEGIYKNDVNSRLGFKEYLKDGKISEQFENDLIDLLWKICDIAGRTRQSVLRGGRVQQRKTMVSEVAGRMGKESTKNERDTLSIFAEEILIYPLVFMTTIQTKV